MNTPTRRLYPLLSAASIILALGTAQAAPVNVGLAFDIGGRNDRGFNQGAYEGALRAIKATGGKITTSDPKERKEVGSGISGLSLGNQLVIGVGFSNNDAITQAAALHPKTRFVTVDDVPSGNNTMGLRFRENEGSFLAGYLAGLQTSTGRVGFIGGLDIPVINRFKVGFRAGAKFACPTCQVRTANIGDTVAAFNTPKVARQIASAMMDNGVDIIYTAAGASGVGTVDQVRARPCLKAQTLPKGLQFRSNAYASVPKSAAYKKACAGESRPTFFIGVDVNQNALGDFDKNPETMNHGLTSMLKRVDNAVYSIIKDVSSGIEWHEGDRSFGLSNGGVSLAIDRYNQALITPKVQQQIKTVEKLIIGGGVRIPSS